jgi:outer membrane lipoprotein-sorting protein
MRNFLPLLFLFCSSKSFSQLTQSKEVFDKMMAAMKGVKSCSFVIDMEEKVRGETKHYEYIVKQNTSPYKIYLYSIKPNPGTEALLIEGENNNKVYVNPNRFPFINMSLNPYNPLVRKTHQYTIWEMGFNYIHSVLDGYLKKYENSFYGFLSLEQDTVSKGKTYYKLVINKNDFRFDDYKVSAGETMTTIAEKLLVNDFMILEANPKYKNYDDVKTGDVIRVPNFYGKKIILGVDKTTFLPMVQNIYDHKGLYSRIDFSSVVLNPNFTPMDFSKENKKYGF